MLSSNPAAYLELFFTADDDGSGRMIVHRAWFTCSGCHAQLGAEYDTHING